MIDYTNNIKLNVVITDINTGHNSLSITNYEWKINNIVQPYNTPSISIHTSTFNIGTNTISIRIQNSCGSWSDEIIKIINIIEGNNMATTTLTSTINSPIQTINAVLNLTSLVTVNVFDQLGNPVGNAFVTVGTNPVVETNLSGIATVPDVLYGEQIITITK